MNVDFTQDFQTALLAQKNGLLFEWLQYYLRSEGNNRKLADVIDQKEPVAVELVQLPLKKLKRAMGPEPQMLYHEEISVWEKRINELTTKISNGVKFPPLVVTDFWEPMVLSDGSHRLEALLRSGFKEYWVILVTGKKSMPGGT